MKTPLWFYELNYIKLLLYKWLPNWMKKKVVAPSNLSLVDLHLCQKNKCIIFVSYICIHIEPTNLPDGIYKLVSEAEAGPGEAQVNFADAVENPNPTPEASN